MRDIGDKLKLFRGLIRGDRAWAGPNYVNIDVTHRCNLRCPMCRWHSSELEQTLLDPSASKDFCLELFDSLCESLAAMGTRTMLFVGAGEPLLHPRIFEMIAAAKHRGFELILYSNGTLLQEERCERLVSSGLDVLRVSLLHDLGGAFATPGDEGGNPEPPESGEARSEQVINGLRRLVRIRAARSAQRPAVELTHPILREDLGRLDEAIRWVREGLVERLGFSVVVDLRQAEIARLSLSEEEVSRLDAELAGLRRRLDDLSIPHNIPAVRFRLQQGARCWETMPCYAPWYYAYVNTDGQVMVCQRGTKPMGDLRRQTFSEIWNGPAYREFRRLAMAPGGIASMQDTFCCDYCCQAVNNARVHRIWRWFLPVRSRLDRSPEPAAGGNGKEAATG